VHETTYGVGAFQDWRFFSSNLEWALAHGHVGHRVFPVRASKRPLIRWGEGASCDPDVITGWWTMWPYAEVGVALDAGMVVADGDCSHGQRGLADLERLAGCSVDDIEAPQSSSPSGGRHIWFATHGRRYANRRLPGAAIDVKSLGGYVLAPAHQNGRKWLKPIWEIPLPPAPAWLDPALKREPLVAVPRAALASGARGERADAPDPAAQWEARVALGRACARIVAALPGSRDTTRHAQSYYVGGLVERGDLSYLEAFDALLAAARAVRHAPPWTGLEEKTARSLEAGMRSPLPALSAEQQWLGGFRMRMRARRAARRAAP
jgi:hypothetical protein